MSGLLCGNDIMAQLKGKSLGQKVCFPGNLLKSGTDVLLDDVTIRDLEEEFQVPFVSSSSDGYEFFDLFLDMDKMNHLK